MSVHETFFRKENSFYGRQALHAVVFCPRYLVLDLKKYLVSFIKIVYVVIRFSLKKSVPYKKKQLQQP